MKRLGPTAEAGSTVSFAARLVGFWLFGFSSPGLGSVRNVLQWLIGTFVLALLLRTWFVLGWVEPVTVAGSSMVPALEPGQQLVVDRRGGTLRRWVPVVFVNAEDGGQLAVKRVVGLPGETITLRQGDVWCNGAVLAKPPAVQRRLRVLVHRETSSERRWHPAAENRWRWSETGWQIDATAKAATEWLDYQHPHGEVITDDLAENADLTWRLFPVRDFFLSARVLVTRGGELALRVRGGRTEVRTAVKLELGAALVELSNFDRRVWLAVDGRIVWEHDLPAAEPVVGTASPFSLGARGCELTVTELALFRDLYYLSVEEAAGYRENLPIWRLGSDEFFALGDNVPVSLDSRQGGPLPLKYLVGRVIFPR